MKGMVTTAVRYNRSPRGQTPNSVTQLYKVSLLIYDKKFLENKL